jgi:preprotein translocase subunit SecG
MIFIIVRQRSHGGFWSGPASNDSTIIFGGNSGADVLQKLTWICGAILIFGTLFLSIYKTKIAQKSKYAMVVKKEENKTSENTSAIDSQLDQSTSADVQ